MSRHTRIEYLVRYNIFNLKGIIKMTPVKKQQNIRTDLGTLTSEEKNLLMKDLQSIGQIIQAHDQGIFQVIVGLNIIQKILLDKNIITVEELETLSINEANRLKAEFLKNTEPKSN